MTTIKIKFRPSTVEGKEGSVYYQILHDRLPRQIPTTYKLFPSEWDNKRYSVIIPVDSLRKTHVSYTRDRIRLDVERLTRIIRKLNDTWISYTSEDVVDEFRNYCTQLSFSYYIDRLVLQKKKNNKTATAGHYRSAILSFNRFLTSMNEKDVMLDSITADTMKAYEVYLHTNNVCRNTSSAYMRSLRAAYNYAVYEGLIEQRNPFKNVYTGVEKTVKRSVSLKIMSKIKSLDLMEDKSLDYARDMFMLSFYFRGMSFVDMAFLKKLDLKDGYLTYHRHKTGQRLSIKWTKDMQDILNKYPVNTSDYLLPIIKQPGLNEYFAYRNALGRVNKALKKVGEIVGAPINLTHYSARHSWASGAQAAGVSLKVISEGMGHDSEITTQIYLASLDNSEIDEANDRILNALK